jgi:DNA-binding NtrC family response regulator
MAGTSKHPILVVDDEAEILHSLRGLLRMEFEVHTANSGQEAIRILQERPIHVILTDQRMPAMTGVELLSRVQGEHPEAIRMVFTGYADIKAVIAAINQGHIFRYITKPWDPDELVAVLRQACGQYEQIVARQGLLGDVQDYGTRSLALVSRLGDGQAEAAQLATTGSELLARLARSKQP